MHRLHWIWISFLAVVSIMYGLSLNTSELTLAPWALRKSLLYYSGVMALAMMSLGMVLALRLPITERLTDGLDRSYRLHKWLGLGAVSFALLHWLIKVEPKALVRQGFVQAKTFETPTGILDFFNDPNPFIALKSIGKSAGEWAIYLLVLLVIIALIKKIPYRRFFMTHRLMPVIYLVLVFHGTVLFGKLGWFSPIGFLMAALMTIGSLAALFALSGHIGQRRQHEGVVIRRVTYQADAITQFDIKMDTRWTGHRTGQFAFVTFDPAEGAHPFSIASHQPAGRLVRFYIKHLGDYTSGLKQSVHPGQQVMVEGPYGNFSFEPASAPQIWVAAGVGITPFMSRLECLAQQATTHPNITFYLCVRHDKGELTQRALTLAQQVGIKTHLVCSDQGHSLQASDLMQQEDWRQRHIWFCGPSTMGTELRSSLTEAGLPDSQFHQELFEMR